MTAGRWPRWRRLGSAACTALVLYAGVVVTLNAGLGRLILLAVMGRAVPGTVRVGTVTLDPLWRVTVRDVSGTHAGEDGNAVIWGAERVELTQPLPMAALSRRVAVRVRGGRVTLPEGLLEGVELVWDDVVDPTRFRPGDRRTVGRLGIRRATLAHLVATGVTSPIRREGTRYLLDEAAAAVGSGRVTGTVEVRTQPVLAGHVRLEVADVPLAALQGVHPSLLAGAAGEVSGHLAVRWVAGAEPEFDGALTVPEPGGSVQAGILTGLLPYLPGEPGASRVAAAVAENAPVRFRSASLTLTSVSQGQINLLLRMEIPEYNVNLETTVELRVDDVTGLLRLGRFLREPGG